MKRNRYEEIDWIRAFLVVLVVLGHALENGSNIVSMTPVKQFLYDWIYSFHMPLFMSLSGFVMSKYIYDINGGWNVRRRLILKRFYRLMIPYFTMSVIFTLAHHALQAYALYASSLSDIWKLFLGESLYTAMWFLYALFLINALTLVFVRPQNVRIWLIASLIPLALYVMKLIPNKTIFKPLNFCASYLFWYLLGVEISHFYESIYTRFQARLGRIAIAATLAHTVTFSLAFAFGFPFGHNFWKSLCSCFAAVALYAYGMSLFRNGKLAEGHHIFSSWWRIFSKYGMDIYILHDLVIFAVRLVFWNFLHWPFAVCTLLKFIFGLFGSLAVSVLIIRKSAILKKFLFGEGW